MTIQMATSNILNPNQINYIKSHINEINNWKYIFYDSYSQYVYWGDTINQWSNGFSLLAPVYELDDSGSIHQYYYNYSFSDSDITFYKYPGQEDKMYLITGVSEYYLITPEIIPVNSGQIYINDVLLTQTKSYAKGKVQLKAIAKNKYSFDYWEIDNQRYLNPIFEYDINKDITIKCIFQENAVTPGGASTIILNGIKINDIKLGANQINEIFLGDQSIWLHKQ